MFEEVAKRILRAVLGLPPDTNIGPDNPLETHDPKVGSLISFEGTTTSDGAPAGASLVCSDLAAPAHPDYNGNLVIITSGDYAGQARDINGTTLAGTVTPSSAFGGLIVEGTNFVIAALRLIPAEVAAIEAKLDHATYGLSALKDEIDANETKIDTVDTVVDAIKAITDALPDAGALTTIQADLDNPDQYKADVAALALEATLATVDGIVDNILLDTQIRTIQSGAKAINGGTKYLHIDAGTNGAEILSIVIEGVIGHDWTLDVYVPAADAEAATQAKSKRDTIPYLAADTEGGLLKPFGIPFDCYLDFTDDGAAGQIDQVTITYRSRAALTLTWET